MTTGRNGGVCFVPIGYIAHTRLGNVVYFRVLYDDGRTMANEASVWFGAFVMPRGETLEAATSGTWSRELAVRPGLPGPRSVAEMTINTYRSSMRGRITDQFVLHEGCLAVHYAVHALVGNCSLLMSLCDDE